jgi:hypothetical protein
LCQTRCYGINALDQGLLTESPIIISVGNGQKDRLMTGSYVELRQTEEAAHSAEQQKKTTTEDDSYLPDVLK